MKTIHKYKLPTELGKHYINIPKNSSILKIGWQRNRDVFNETNLCLWALVDNKYESSEGTEFFITTTGKELGMAFNTRYTYVDSVMNNDGQYILHIFIRKESNDY